MTVEFIGMIHHRQASEIHPPPPVMLDRGYIRDFAQAAEAGGFDRVLVGYFADGPDGFLLAAAAAAHTERLGFLVAHRPGYVAPTLAARKFATLDQITDGRAAMHVITGGDDADQFRDGDTLSKDERYDRTDEYVGILKRIWTEPGPTVDHEGRFYRFKGASTAIRCVQQPRIPIYFGGASDAALRVSAPNTPTFMRCGAKPMSRSGKSPPGCAPRRRRTAARSASASRCVPSSPPPRMRPGRAPRRIKQRIIELRAKAGSATREPPNEGSRRLLAAAAKGERLDKRLWTGAALATGARGNTTSLVGTPRQVAEALCDYYDLGVTTFLIRGFDPLEDNIEYGRHLLPLTKKLIAERDAARAAAE